MEDSGTDPESREVLISSHQEGEQGTIELTGEEQGEEGTIELTGEEQPQTGADEEVSPGTGEDLSEEEKEMKAAWIDRQLEEEVKAKRERGEGWARTGVMKGDISTDEYRAIQEDLNKGPTAEEEAVAQKKYDDSWMPLLRKYREIDKSKPFKKLSREEKSLVIEVENRGAGQSVLWNERAELIRKDEVDELAKGLGGHLPRTPGERFDLASWRADALRHRELFDPLGSFKGETRNSFADDAIKRGLNRGEDWKWLISYGYRWTAGCENMGNPACSKVVKEVSKTPEDSLERSLLGYILWATSMENGMVRGDEKVKLVPGIPAWQITFRLKHLEKLYILEQRTADLLKQNPSTSAEKVAETMFDVGDSWGLDEFNKVLLSALDNSGFFANFRNFKLRGPNIIGNPTFQRLLNHYRQIYDDSVSLMLLNQSEDDKKEIQADIDSFKREFNSVLKEKTLQKGGSRSRRLRKKRRSNIRRSTRKNTRRKNTRRKNTRRKNTRRRNTRRKNTRRRNTRRKNTRRRSTRRRY